jgi:hypothetical protein
MKHFSLILTAALVFSACASMKKTPIDEPSTLEGLQRVEVKGIDAAFRKPGSSLTKYTKLLVHAPQIAFSKSFDENQTTTGSLLRSMSRPDREKIKKDLSDAFAEVFVRELEKEGGYTLVKEDGADVLEVTPAIVNLYITAPDTSMQTAGRVKTYTTNAGEMTLVIEFHDSITHELLGRAYDRQPASDSATWEWTTSVSNGGEARRIIASWATTLRKALDASRAK